MKKFIALLKVSVRSMLVASSGIGRGKKKKAVSGFGAVLLIAGLGMYISGIYSSLLVSVLAPVGMEGMVFIFMGLAALITGLMFTAFGASGTLYGGKDNDLMLSLPVSSTQLVAARVAAIYLENLLLSFFMLVPAGVACAVMASSGTGRTVDFWLRLVSAALLLPLLDTALSVLVGAVIAWLGAKMKHRALGQNLIMAVYMVGVFWFAFRINGMVEHLSVYAADVKASMGWAAPAVWMGDGIMGDWMALGKFALVCVIPCVLVVYGLGKCYRKAVTSFRAASARSDYKLSAQRSSGVFRALVAKEAKRFFGTPVYFWNCGIGLLMMVGLSVFALIKKADLMAAMAAPELSMLLLPGACAVMGFCLSTSPICAPSVSMEGKQLWLLRESPVSERLLIGIKTGFQLALALPCILISAACLCLALNLDALQTLTLVAFAVVFEVGDACFGSLVGLNFARTDLDDTSILKRSLLSFLSVFAPMALLGLLGVAAWLIWTRAGMAVAVGTVFALTAAFALACWILLRAKGAQMLRKL